MVPNLKALLQREKHKAISEPICGACQGRCCQSCAAESAWFRDYDGESYGTFLYLKRKYKWDEKKGFLSETGCVLPAQERSITCLSYYCTRVFTL